MYRLTIENFQSIENLSIDIRDFTSLVGKSNRGKSAIVRALRVVLYNEWEASYLREGTKECRISLEILQKSEYLKSILPEFNIERVEIRKPANEYTVWLDDGTKLSYPKVGKNTPEVFSKIALSEIESERKDFFNLNFQAQLDPLFLVTGTDVVITSFINKVFDISRFEKALREMRSDEIKISRTVKEYEDKILEIETTKKTLDTELITAEDLQKKLGDKIAEAKTANADWVNKEGNLIHLRNLIGSLGNLQSEKQTVSVWKKLQAIIPLLQDFLCRFQRAKTLQAEYSHGLKSLLSLKEGLPPIQALSPVLKIWAEELCKKEKISTVLREKDAFEKMKSLPKVLFVFNSLLRIISARAQNINNTKKQMSSFTTIFEDRENFKMGKNVLENVQKVNQYLRSQFKVCPVCNKSFCEDTV